MSTDMGGIVNKPYKPIYSDMGGFPEASPRLLSNMRSGPVGDPLWDKVVSLVLFQGTEGQTTITDEVPGITWTRVNTTAVITKSNSVAPNQGISCMSMLSAANAGAFKSNAGSMVSLVTGDFTLEGVVNPTALGTDNLGTTLEIDDGTINIRPVVPFWEGAAGNGELIVQLNRSTPSVSTDITKPAAPLGNYVHWSVCRKGSDYYAHIEGRLVSYINFTTALESNANLLARIGGSSSNNARQLFGYYQWTRITSVARYPIARYRPPVGIPYNFKG